MLERVCRSIFPVFGVERSAGETCMPQLLFGFGKLDIFREFQIIGKGVTVGIMHSFPELCRLFRRKFRPFTGKQDKGLLVFRQ